jgi:hypothetical protein
VGAIASGCIHKNLSPFPVDKLGDGFLYLIFMSLKYKDLARVCLIARQSILLDISYSYSIEADLGQKQGG